MTNRNQSLLGLLLIIVWAAIILACIISGCATLRLADDVGEVRTSLIAAEQRIGEVDARIGEINIGGGGDNLTTWILAAGAALYYPMVGRRLRKRWEKGVKRKRWEKHLQTQNGKT